MTVICYRFTKKVQLLFSYIAKKIINMVDDFHLDKYSGITVFYNQINLSSAYRKITHHMLVTVIEIVIEYKSFSLVPLGTSIHLCFLLKCNGVLIDFSAISLRVSRNCSWQ